MRSFSMFAAKFVPSKYLAWIECKYDWGKKRNFIFRSKKQASKVLFFTRAF